MSNELPLALARLLEAEEREQEQEVSIPAPATPAPKEEKPIKPADLPPHPLIVRARNVLRVWDLTLESTGSHRYLQGPGRRQWFVLELSDGTVTFEEI